MMCKKKKYRILLSVIHVTLVQAMKKKKKKKAMWEAPHNDRTKQENEMQEARASISGWKSVLRQTHKIQRI